MISDSLIFFGLKFKKPLLQVRSKWLLLVFHGFLFSSLPMTKHLKRGCQDDISFGLAQHVLFYFAIVIHDCVFSSSLLKNKVVEGCL